MLISLEISTIVIAISLLVIFQIAVGGFLFFRRHGNTKINIWEDHIDQMFKMAPNGMCLATEEGEPIKYNNHLCGMFGYDPYQPSPTDVCPIRVAICKYVTNARINNGAPQEWAFPHKNGDEVWCLMTATEITIKNRTMILVNMFNITERKQAEATIHKLAYYDSLTELPNRTYFTEHTPRLLTSAHSDRRKLALFLVDIDDFKRVNDNFGHHFGDELLRQTAIRLADVISPLCTIGEVSNCECFAARLGGDEFVLFLEEVNDAEQASRIADVIFNAFEEPIQLEEQHVHVNLSVGIALFPYDGNSISTLLKSADLALYAAKDKGKNQFHFHEISMNTRLEEYMQYECALHDFIDTQDFDLHYQPIFNIDGTLHGAETLFRSNPRKYEKMELERLIGVAEDTGLIVPLGNQILRRACQTWVKQMGGTNTFVSVNLSMRQLDEKTIVKDILDILYETGLPPEKLVVEITETAFMHNFRENVRKLTKLHNTGINIAIDDFGKGYSSMSYVQQLPVSKLKIDLSFVKQMIDDPKSAEIVKVIIILAHTLGLTALAEGVETEEQHEMLRSFSCDEIQGYLKGAPMPIKQLKEQFVL